MISIIRTFSEQYPLDPTSCRLLTENGLEYCIRCYGCDVSAHIVLFIAIYHYCFSYLYATNPPKLMVNTVSVWPLSPNVYFFF